MKMFVLLYNGGTLAITDYYRTQYKKPINLTGAELQLLASTINENRILGTLSRLFNLNNSKTHVLN